jgi:hypothetical protein
VQPAPRGAYASIIFGVGAACGLSPNAIQFDVTADWTYPQAYLESFTVFNNTNYPLGFSNPSTFQDPGGYFYKNIPIVGAYNYQDVAINRYITSGYETVSTFPSSYLNRCGLTQVKVVW